MTGEYTIRFRSTAALGTPALVVEDHEGAAYLFIANRLQVRVRGERACEKLVRLLGGWDSWDEVTRVSPYSVEALGGLLGCGQAAPRGEIGP